VYVEIIICNTFTSSMERINKLLIYQHKFKYKSVMQNHDDKRHLNSPKVQGKSVTDLTSELSKANAQIDRLKACAKLDQKALQGQVKR